MNRTQFSFWMLFGLLALISCTSSKTPHISTTQEPNDLPPSPRYSVVMMALRDELPCHGDLREFFLCQSPDQMAALQRDWPAFTLRHASETYTAPVQGWPGIVWCHRRSDDALATIDIDIDATTDDTIKNTLWIGHQAPNFIQMRHTFRRRYSSWLPLRRVDGPELRI